MKKNILVISPYNPFGPSLGGSSRSVRTRIERLSRDANVTLLTFFDEIQNEDTVNSLKINVVFARYSPAANSMGTGFHRLPATISGRLMIFTHIEAMVDALVPVVKEILKKQQFDLIQLEDIVIAPIARYLPKNVKKVLFFHNVLTTYFERIRDSKIKIATRISATVEWYWIRRFEKAILRFFDAAVVITDEEFRQVGLLSGSIALYKIPLEVDTAAIVPRFEKQDFPIVSFCGTMSYPPNEEAVLYFAATMLPLIRKRVPDILFHIVGRNPGAEVKRLAGDSVIVTGEVENVQDYLSKSTIIVVPIITGAGMRIKILEAFAMGKAVVSTSMGAEGIAYSDNVDIMIGDNPADFAEKVCILLDNRAKADTLGKNARKLVEREYDAEIVWKKWQAVYNELLYPLEKIANSRQG